MVPREKKKRPGYLKRYAQHAGIALSSAAEPLRRVGIDYFQPYDFAEADKRRLNSWPVRGLITSPNSTLPTLDWSLDHENTNGVSKEGLQILENTVWKGRKLLWLKTTNSRSSDGRFLGKFQMRDDVADLAPFLVVSLLALVIARLGASL